jgi:hypothetical protein
LCRKNCEIIIGFSPCGNFIFNLASSSASFSSLLEQLWIRNNIDAACVKQQSQGVMPDQQAS